MTRPASTENAAAELHARTGLGMLGPHFFFSFSAVTGAKCWNTSACFSRNASRRRPRSSCAGLSTAIGRAHKALKLS